MEDIQNTQLRDMDDYLKQLIVQHWDNAIQSVIAGNIKKAFLSYKSLFHIIEPYEFTTKKYLKQLTYAIQSHLDQLGGNPMTESDLLTFNQEQTTIRDLLNDYQSKIPKAYSECNLWLKTATTYSDIQEQLASENFSSDLTSLDKKKTELLKNFDLKKALDIMNKNHIHDLYWRFRYNDI